jgi:hypothetical protein
MKGKYMDIKNTFMVTQEMAELAKKYDDLSEQTQNEELKDAYSQFVSKLDEYHSKMLRLSMYSTDDVVEKEAVNTSSLDGLPSHCKLTVLYEYHHEGLALVESTGSSLYLVPLDKLRFE